MVFFIHKRGLIAAFLFTVLILSDSAFAVEFKISGEWLVGFEYSNVTPRHARHTNNDGFGAFQRFRMQLEARASDYLSGVVQTAITHTEWGNAAQGGALGSDGKNVKIRLAYLDWMIPNTEIKVRMGLDVTMLPGVISNWGFSAIYGRESAGVRIYSPIYRGKDITVDATAFWVRPYNDNAENQKWRWLDNMDNFALILPIQGKGFSLKPYVMYSMMGKFSLSDLIPYGGDPAILAPRGGLMPVLGGAHTYSWFQNNYVQGLDRMWGDGLWASLVGDVDLTDDLKLYFEGVYGYVDMGKVKNYKGFEDGKNKTFHVRREGWYIGARLECNLDWGVPGLIAWYGSGDDDNPYNGSERLPQYNTPWAVSSLGFGGDMTAELSWKVLGHNPSGLVGLIGQIERISFLPKLDHTVRFGYYWGTNSTEMPKKAHMTFPSRVDGPNAYLTTTDNAWEVNFLTNYKMYENYNITLDTGYVRLNLDGDTWQGAHKANWKDNYRVGLLFHYYF